MKISLDARARLAVKKPKFFRRVYIHVTLQRFVQIRFAAGVFSHLGSVISLAWILMGGNLGGIGGAAQFAVNTILQCLKRR